MIDFHSHILPGIDDGSKNVEMSVGMLQRLARQGVDTVCATSHFYASQNSPKRFLERREAAYERLKPYLTDVMPRIRTGAEVFYFRGISRAEELPSLFLEGTNILLLEMPFEDWSEYEVSEVIDLARSGEMLVLLAHIERYLSHEKLDVLEYLLENGARIQSNAEFFLGSFLQTHKALNLLKNGYIQVLGTDCHNLTTRAPHMREATQVIARKLGEGTLRSLVQRGYDYLEEWRA